MFGVVEAKLLGHVIFERGISIDLDQVEALLKLQMLGSKMEMRSFFGKINFVRMFITRFAKIVKPLNEMMKKDAKVKWTTEAKEDFSQNKKSIAEAPVLTSLDYTMSFYIYSFASLHLGATILT